MMAMELVEDPKTKKPATALTKAYRVKLYENGLVNVIAGTYDNVIRTLMPLTIEWETLDKGLDIMEETLRPGRARPSGRRPRRTSSASPPR